MVILGFMAILLSLAAFFLAINSAKKVEDQNAHNRTLVQTHLRGLQTDLAERNEVLNKRLAAMEEEVRTLKREMRATPMEEVRRSSDTG
ncbi:MAG: hypothetical protein ISR48_05870 [Alphaproteobacteria bacterium]|nr:hypothetical protein [Alphaproteobacteria bacterium]